MSFTRLFENGRLTLLPADGSAPVRCRVDAAWLADQLRAEAEPRRRARGTLTPREPVDHDANDRALALICWVFKGGAAAILAGGLYALLVAAAFWGRS